MFSYTQKKKKKERKPNRTDRIASETPNSSAPFCSSSILFHFSHSWLSPVTASLSLVPFQLSLNQVNLFYSQILIFIFCFYQCQCLISRVCFCRWTLNDIYLYFLCCFCPLRSDLCFHFYSSWLCNYVFFVRMRIICISRVVKSHIQDLDNCDQILAFLEDGWDVYNGCVYLRMFIFLYIACVCTELHE